MVKRGQFSRLTRRRFSKGFAVAATSLGSVGVASENAAASSDTYSWDNEVYIYPYYHHISTCCEHIQTTYHSSEGVYEYKFHISSDGVSHDGNNNEIDDLIRSAMKFKYGNCEHAIVTYYTLDQSITGFYPKDGDNASALNEVTAALDTAVGLIYNSYGWASSAFSIAENLINIIDDVSSDSEWQNIIERLFDTRYSECSHHTKIIIEYDGSCSLQGGGAEQICRCQLGGAIIEFKIVIDKYGWSEADVVETGTSSSSLKSPEEMTKVEKDELGLRKTFISDLRDPSAWMYETNNPWVWELTNPPLSVKRTDL